MTGPTAKLAMPELIAPVPVAELIMFEKKRKAAKCNDSWLHNTHTKRQTYQSLPSAKQSERNAQSGAWQEKANLKHASMHLGKQIKRISKQMRSAKTKSLQLKMSV